MLCVLGVRVTQARGKNHLPVSPALRVANHLSDLDALILNALSPSMFVTSIEVRQSRITGWIARAGGSVFVERRSVGGLLREITAISHFLKSGFDVVLFPEGTSTNGDTLKPFRSALFTAALDANVPIQPIAIRYTRIQGQPVTPLNRDQVYFYGDMAFFPHLFRLAGAAPIEVEVAWLEPIGPIPSQDRRDVARESQQRIFAYLQSGLGKISPDLSAHGNQGDADADDTRQKSNSGPV